MAVLNLVMNKLVESHERGKTDGNGSKAQDLSGLTFSRCHKKGRFQENLPLEKKAEETSGNEENTATYGYEPITD